MNKPVAELFEQARKLTARERAELAELLLASVEPSADIDNAIAQEADRRWQEHQHSGDATLDAFEAIEGLRQELKDSGKVRAPRKKA